MEMSEIIEYLKANISGAAVSAATRLLGAALIVVIGFWMIKKLAKIFVKAPIFKRVDKSVASFMNNLALIVLKALVLFTAAAVLGVPTASIVALLGSFGLAIGLALQGSLSNLAGGVLIVFFKTFRIGDYIETSDGKAGTVVNIGVIYTTIKTIGNNIIVIPNGSLSNQLVTNYSGTPTRRLDMKFGVAYDSDVQLVKKILTDAATEHPLIDQNEEIFVRLFSVSEGTLTFVLRAWCKSDDHWTIYFELNEIIKEAFDKNGIWIPFKEMDINIKNRDETRMRPDDRQVGEISEAEATKQ